MMRKIFVLLLLNAVSWVYAADNTLFFQYATNATIAKLHNNSYVLTLQNTPEYITYFSEGRVKKSGMINLREFLSFWGKMPQKNMIIKNPLYVSMSLVSQNSIFQNATILVSNPSYVNKNLSYQITMTDNQLLEIGKLKHLVLIFEDIAWNPGG